jgi:threonine synthase
VDPHTACGFKELARDRVSVVLATASPAKFPATIQAAIGIEPRDPALEALKDRPVIKHRIPATATAIAKFVTDHAV